MLLISILITTWIFLTLLSSYLFQHYLEGKNQCDNPLLPDQNLGYHCLMNIIVDNFIIFIKKMKYYIIEYLRLIIIKIIV